MIINLNNISDLDKLLSQHKKVIIDCYATWCGPCQMLAPQLEQLAKSHSDWTIIKADVDKVPEIAQKFAFQAVPTIIYIVDKQLKETTTGYLPASELEKIIGRL